MKVEIFTILILDIILVIGGITLDDVVIEYKSHTDNYDITTIYKKTSGYSAGEEKNQKQFNITKCFGCYDAKIYLRTNAIGMPIEFNGSILSSNKKSLELIADSKYPTTIYTRNQIKYNINKWSISKSSIVDPTEIVQIPLDYELLLWDASSITESFKVKWKQRNSMKMCISVSYLLEDKSKCTFSMNLTAENSLNKRVIINSTNIKESKVLSTVLFKSNNWLYENEIYSLNFKLERISHAEEVYDNYRGWVDSIVYAKGCKIGIKRIAQCTDEYENEEILTIKTEELRSTLHEGTFLTFNIYPFKSFDAHAPQMESVLSFTGCANGGFSNKNGCTCPPGFKGNKCEHGCGPNTFGVDCTGICSIRQTQCRQMMFCTKGFGCNCPAGYTGDDCNTECTSGTYGVNCNQLCSKQCHTTSCDAYTGFCNKGCATSYIAPDCKEKYPWLKSPPELESSDLKSLKLKIDFNSENIEGSRNVNSVYYQILFKITSNESEFKQLELKKIRQQNSVIEFIDNLKPGISYSFGVMLVAEDGNSNKEDMKIVNYTTKCLLSRDYNVSLLSGTDYINVTWNKLNGQNEEDCYITGYFLKLMIGNTQLQDYSEEVISNDNHGYVFKNLLYGEKYAVQVTAISAAGRVKASEISYVYTEPYGFVQVKNIKAKLNQSSSLIITWDVEEKYANTPIHYNIKYKINKHLSCSNEVITNNWTSLLVYNQTQIEIWDLIPNTQYVIKVEPAIKGYTYDDNVNIIFVITPISNPKLKPIIINDENGSYITNHSAYFNWTINKTECSKLNGLFQGYQVILKDIVEGTHVSNWTTENTTANYDELKPSTKYELQLYVVTNYGYNSKKGLLLKFKTKTKFLKPVDDLIVYKKNLKRKSIGIRWSFPDENIINGFIVSTIDENNNSTNHMTIDPKRCVAWQKLYCTTLENLIPNHQYTIKIKAKSIDYPTGGCTSSVVSNFNDGFADKPDNLRATDVGTTHISLEWDIPWIFNGMLKSFIVSTEEISSKDIDKCCDSQPDLEIPITEELPTYNCTIKDLKPGSTYSIGVLAKTSTYGQTNRIHVTTLSTPAVAEDVENNPLITINATQTSAVTEHILSK